MRKSPAETLQDYCAASDVTTTGSVIAFPVATAVPIITTADGTDKVLPAIVPDGVSDGSTGRPGPSDGVSLGAAGEVTHAAHTPTLLKLVPLRTMMTVA